MKRRRLLIVIVSSCLVLLGLVITLRSLPPRLYRVTTLPSLGGNSTMPCAINDRGQVVGTSVRADGTRHLFLWDRENGIQDLGPADGYRALINDPGQIVTSMRDPNDNYRALIRDPNGQRRILPTLGGDLSDPFAINNVGQVVGSAETASGDRHAFIWDADNGIRDLTPDSKKPTRAIFINDVGQVVVLSGDRPWLIDTREGAAFTPQTSPLHAGYKINNAGVIVGLSKRVKGKVNVEVWRLGSGVETIAQSIGAFFGVPLINDAGQVLFRQGARARVTLLGRRFFFAPVRNYLWDARRGQVALDAHVKLKRGEQLVIYALNNQGCLVGAVQYRKGTSSRGVLLEPIPERWDK